MIETIIRNFTIDRIWFIIKKKMIFAILFALIGAAAGGIFAQSQKSTLYRARVTFYLYSKGDYLVDSDAYVNNSDFVYAQRLVQSYVMILKSSSVMSKVIEYSGINYSPAALSGRVSYSVVQDTPIFYVFVTDEDPYTAMTLANSIAETAPDVIADIAKTGGISVIDYATLPSAPYSETNILKYILLGGAVGFALPFALFLFFGLLDTTIRKTDELTNMFEIPILGEIPMIKTGSKKHRVSKIVSSESPFAVTESYNSLSANILYTTKGEQCPVYAVTSSLQNEGKTLNSINIAKTLSSLGKKTLLIDADLRNPSVGRYLDDDTEKGLSLYLAALKKEIDFVSIGEHLDVLFAGKVPPNPAELIASKRFAELLDSCKQKYDFIIIDMPPVGVVSDALLIKDLVVGYLIVVCSNFTKLTDEKRIIEKFETTGANISGFVFNAVDAKSSGAYYRYSYDYGYGNKPKKDKKRI